LVSGNYSAYFPALEAAQIVGDKVVRDIVEHWSVRESTFHTNPHYSPASP
jgi:purine nucleoside permease